MPWLKRNVFLVLGGLIALGLLAFAIYFLMGKSKADASVTEELDGQIAAFKELVNRPVHPGTEKVNNIQAAKQDLKRLHAFTADLRKHFAPSPLPEKLNNQAFRSYLDNTISELQRNATNFNITLPHRDYWFTFAALKTAVEFNQLETWTAQLADIKAVCEILYEARIHGLSGVKRPAVAPEDSPGTGDFTEYGRSVTNDWAVVSPYEVTFQCFSSELAGVLQGFARAQQCFIVKNVGVDKAPPAPSTTPTTAPIQQPVYTPYSPYNPYGGSYGNPYDRYGGRGERSYDTMRYRSPYGLPPPTLAPAAPAVPKGPTFFLDENKLKVTLLVQAVKLIPPKQAKPAKQDKAGEGAGDATSTEEAVKPAEQAKATEPAAAGEPAKPAETAKTAK